MSYKGASRTKWRVNFWVDVLIGLAFVVTAATGIIKYLPSSWFGGPTASPLGVSYALWTDIHDWSGFLIVGGIVLHAALHWNWIVSTTRRTFGLKKASREATRTAVAAEATAGSTLPETASLAAPAHRTPAASAAPLASAAQPSPVETRFTRRRFLAGTVVALAAVSAGAAVGRLAAGSEDVEAADSTSKSSTDTSASDLTGTPGASETSTGSSTVQQSPALVTVDASRCTGCGSCLQACPAGVFAASSDGRSVTAQNPAACRLCGRCLQVCPAGAITLNT